VIAEARAVGYERVIGMRDGVQGLLRGDIVDLTAIPGGELETLKRTPAAALGSCRYKLQAGDAEKLAATCAEHGIEAWVYIGGNDSADTSRQVAEVATGLKVIGVPKTIDNDLPGTDHCPGYGSAARFVASVTRETALDTWAMRHTDPIRLIEVMGRHAGWLPGAAWLARGEAPHLVYVPERPKVAEDIIADVQRVYAAEGWCVVVLCENQPIGPRGEPRWVDAFGHAYFDSPAQQLMQRITGALKVRARWDKPGTIQRNALGYVSTADRAEAELVGRAAVRLAAQGQTNLMVTLERTEPYEIRTGTVPLATVANEQRRLPDTFINEEGNGLTVAFTHYARPLIGEPLPDLLRL